MKVKPARIEEGRTKYIVEHNGKDLTFIFPAIGPCTYAEAGNRIISPDLKLKRPSMSQVASLVNTAFNSDDRYSQEIQRILKENWLLAFTGQLYIHKEGVYIQDNPEIRNGLPFMNKSDLEIKLEQKDPSVRFTPFGFKTGEMTPKGLAKNSFVIAQAGEEGADKLAEVAGKLKYNPHLFSFESVDEQLTRVSALDSGWYSGRGLGVGGYYLGYGGGGFALGYA